MRAVSEDIIEIARLIVKGLCTKCKTGVMERNETFVYCKSCGYKVWREDTSQ